MLLTGTTLLAELKYPVARKEAFDTVIYNKKLSNEYGWMSMPRYKKEMEEYRRQQGKLTEAILNSITGTDIITAKGKKMHESFSPDGWHLKEILNGTDA